MAYYSFIVFSHKEVGIEDPYILLDVGMNVFSAATFDLEGLLSQLKAEGVVVKKVMCLSDHEPVTMDQTFKLPEVSQSSSEHILDTGVTLTWTPEPDQ